MFECLLSWFFKCYILCLVVADCNVGIVYHLYSEWGDSNPRGVYLVQFLKCLLHSIHFYSVHPNNKRCLLNSLVNLHCKQILIWRRKDSKLHLSTFEKHIIINMDFVIPLSTCAYIYIILIQINMCWWSTLELNKFSFLHNYRWREV